MATKRSPAVDNIYPPKKRALYEHKMLYGIDSFSTNHPSATSHMTGSDVNRYHNTLETYGMKLPISHSETFIRPRSDSLQSDSQQSTNSDHTELESSRSRETSPCTIQAMFDHHTPERVPITSLDGVKPDISKPLFPSSDSDSSIVDSEDHLSPKVTKYGVSEETYISNLRKQTFQSADMLRVQNVPNYVSKGTAKEILPMNLSKNFLGNEQEKISYINPRNVESNDRSLKNGGTFGLSETRNQGMFFGPMVSLMNRFNAETVQDNRMNGSVMLTAKASIDSNSQRDPAVLANLTNLRLNAGHSAVEPLSMSDDKKIPDENIICRICNRTFANRGYLHTHMKSHNDKEIPCWVCKQTFSSAENLNNHMKVDHNGENPYKCEHCSREFTQYNNLRRHMRVHRENVFKCGLCDREFNEEFYLKMHMGTHTGKRVYSCGVCGLGFPSNHDLKMHVKTHSPSLLHTCDICDKSFSKACVLRQHKKGHSGTRPHQCDQCDKTFIHRHHLTMHLKSHENEKTVNKKPGKPASRQLIPEDHTVLNDERNQTVKPDAGVKSPRVKSDLSKRLKDVSKTLNYSRPDNVSSRSPVSQITESSYDSLMFNAARSPNQSVQSSLQCSPQLKLKTVYPDLGNQNSSQIKVTSHHQQMPSMSQAYGLNLDSFPKAPVQNFYPVPTTQPYSSMYNPLHAALGSPFHSMNAYSSIYRNYSEQVQKYYSHLQMMNYLSQNTFLHQSLGLGQTPLNYVGANPQAVNGNFYPAPSTSPSTETEVKVDSEQENQEHSCVDSEETDTESEHTHSENGKSNLGASETVIDVMTVSTVTEYDNKTSIQGAGCSEKGEMYVTNKKSMVSNKEEHEIAHELLKMSAGGKDTVVEEKVTKLDTSVEHENVSLQQSMTGHNLKQVKNTFKNQKTSENSHPASLIYTDKCFHIKSIEDAAGVLSTLGPCSPLQKLERFVESEKESLNIDEHEIGNDNYMASDLSKILNDSETNIVAQRSSVDGKEGEVNNHCGGESLESRLEKIRKFADIGQRYGHCVSTKSEDKANKFESENNKFCENVETDQVPDTPVDEEVENGNVEILEEVSGVIQRTEYFNESLEEKNLEIDESEELNESESDLHLEMHEPDNVANQELGSVKKIEMLNNFKREIESSKIVVEESKRKLMVNYFQDYELQTENMPMDLSCGKKDLHNSLRNGDVIKAKPADTELNVKKQRKLQDQQLKGKSGGNLESDQVCVGFICKYCDESFDSLNAFDIHRRSHDGSDKPYLCRICRRTFSHRHNLNRHMMSHNSKSFECDICQRTFKEAFYLQMHKKAHEEGTSMCQICGENVAKSEILRHTNKHLADLTDNPSYKEIGNRVQEILKEKKSSVNRTPEKLNVLQEQVLRFPNVNGTLEELANLMRLSRSEKHLKGGELKLKNVPRVMKHGIKENIENFNVGSAWF